MGEYEGRHGVITDADKSKPVPETRTVRNMGDKDIEVVQLSDDDRQGIIAEVGFLVPNQREQGDKDTHDKQQCGYDLDAGNTKQIMNIVGFL